MPNEAEQEAIEIIRVTLGPTLAGDLEDLRRQALDSARACRIEEAVEYLGRLVERIEHLRSMTSEPQTENYRQIYQAASDYEALALTDFAQVLVRDCGCRPITPGLGKNGRPIGPVELE